MQVTVYLKTPLFAVGHVPQNAWVLEAELLNQGSAGLELAVSKYLDHDGRELQGSPLKLLLPSGKVDHVLLKG